MPDELTELQEAGTVRETCERLEELLQVLRDRGFVARLPTEFQFLAARNPAELHHWWDLLDRHAQTHSGRLNSYFVMFDVARLRVERLRNACKTQAEFIAYATSKQQARLPPRHFASLDDAVGGCISLLDSGHQILSVELPNGKSVPGSRIARAVRVGRSTLVVALTAR